MDGEQRKQMTKTQNVEYSQGGYKVHAAEISEAALIASSPLTQSDTIIHTAKLS